MLLGYARIRASGSDAVDQRNRLLELGVDEANIVLDRQMLVYGGTRPGLQQVIDACVTGDQLVVTRLGRLAKSVSDAARIVQALAERSALLNIDGTVYDPSQGNGQSLVEALSLVTELEADLLRSRTRSGLGRPSSAMTARRPKLTARQERHLVRLFNEDQFAIDDLARLFGVPKATVYRAIESAIAEPLT